MRRGPSKMGYDPDAADDAWSRMLAFFGEHLAPRVPRTSGVA